MDIKEEERSQRSGAKSIKRWFLFLVLLLIVVLSPIIYVAVDGTYNHYIWTKRMTNSHLVVVGVDSTSVKKWLGEPDDRWIGGWSYSEKGLFGPGEIFEIKFKEGVVCSTDRYYF